VQYSLLPRILADRCGPAVRDFVSAALDCQAHLDPAHTPTKRQPRIPPRLTIDGRATHPHIGAPVAA
jgi:thymidylate synthase